jgi:homoserine O-succinyltransferase
MAAYLDTSIAVARPGARARTVGPGRWKNPNTGKPLRIGLVNNMPDGALVATERQFCGLVETATQGQVRVGLYFLPGLSRGEEARKVLDARYRPASDLYRAGADAVIVTGNEPRAARLDDEPYWPELTELIDWARDNTAAAAFSCLAAHAAVLHLDGIERRRLPEKRSGVYVNKVVCETGMSLPGTLSTCHSRLNEVPKRDLQRHGYSVISEAAGDHVDVFARSWASNFLFLQGHPEYAPDSLMKEYRRDVGRFLNGQRPAYPAIPENYFDAPTVRAMEAYRVIAERQPDPHLLEAFPAATLRRDLVARLARSADAVFDYWLSSLVDALDAR